MVKIKKTKKDTNKKPKYSEVRHIINQLYRIKGINRKINYYPDTLRDLVITSETGFDTINNLILLGVTRKWLKENKLIFLEGILGDYFPE